MGLEVVKALLIADMHVIVGKCVCISLRAILYSSLSITWSSTHKTCFISVLKVARKRYNKKCPN